MNESILEIIEQITRLATFENEDNRQSILEDIQEAKSINEESLNKLNAMKQFRSKN